MLTSFVYSSIFLPISVYQPFVDVCLKHGNRKEAAKYIPKCSADDRYRLYIKIE